MCLHIGLQSTFKEAFRINLTSHPANNGPGEVDIATWLSKSRVGELSSTPHYEKAVLVQFGELRDQTAQLMLRSLATLRNVGNEISGHMGPLY